MKMSQMNITLTTHADHSEFALEQISEQTEAFCDRVQEFAETLLSQLKDERLLHGSVKLYVER